MSDKTIAHLDLTNCSTPYDFFERVIKAFSFDECGHNWDALYDFICTETPVETLYITGEGTVSNDLKWFVDMLHTVLTDVNTFRMKGWNVPFTVIVLS